MSTTATISREGKPCVLCAFYRPQIKGEDRCGSPSAPVDAVTGADLPCAGMRTYTGACGPLGLMFTAKSVGNV